MNQQGEAAVKISMICFSLTGQDTGERLKRGLSSCGHEVTLYKKSKYLPDSIKESSKDWAGEQFRCADAILFIGACGIAVRSIAPFVEGKKTDPAVLVADECGRFVISLLSGHLGGANELTLQAAEILGAAPVVTTATDLHNRFAVDVFAKKNGCSIFYMKAAKEVSAALLAGERVGFYSEFPWEGQLPEGLVLCDETGYAQEDRSLEDKSCRPSDVKKAGESRRIETGLAVTIHKSCHPFPSTTQIVPRAVILGMGCRKGKDAEQVQLAASNALEQKEVYQEALAALATIDIKKEEPAFQRLSEKWSIPLETFSAEELLALPGEFTSSAFVKKTVGVDNVCERSAILAGEGGALIQKKLAADGVTAALARKNWRIRFE